PARRARRGTFRARPDAGADQPDPVQPVRALAAPWTPALDRALHRRDRRTRPPRDARRRGLCARPDRGLGAAARDAGVRAGAARRAAARRAPGGPGLDRARACGGVARVPAPRQLPRRVRLPHPRIRLATLAAAARAAPAAAALPRAPRAALALAAAQPRERAQGALMDGPIHARILVE